MSVGAGIGAGTAIVGGELQGWAALLDKWAMQKAYQAEAHKQNEYAAQAGDVLYGTPARATQVGGTGNLIDLSKTPGSIAQASPASAQAMMQQGAGARRQAYSDIGKVPLGSGFSPMSNFNPSASDAYLGLVGDARAKLGGYSDWAVQQAINNLRNQQRLNQITSFAGGQAKNVFPLQMYAAQHDQDALAAIGQAISSVGGAAGNFAQLYASNPPSTNYQFTPTGNMVSPALWSGYGGAGNLPPAGTGYNPYTDQSTLFGAPSYYMPG